MALASWRDSCTPTGVPEDVCNGVENDCDGLTGANDPDCQQVNCSIYGYKPSCNNDPNCKWMDSPTNGQCNPA